MNEVEIKAYLGTFKPQLSKRYKAVRMPKGVAAQCLLCEPKQDFATLDDCMKHVRERHQRTQLQKNT